MTDHPRLFAIGDLHLPGGQDKPMHVFGNHWEGHFDKISRDWQQRVQEHDIVLIPGDISWAMHLEDAMADLEAIGALPGRKVLLRGNHDYWWSSLTKLRESLPKGMHALQNDALMLGGRLLCGARGWMGESDAQSEHDRKIYRRELQRMRLSLDAGNRLAEGLRPVVLTHFPPAGENGEPSEMTELFSQYQVSDVVYGHVHGPSGARAFQGEIDGVRYHPVACDRLGFTLYEVSGG